MSETYSVVEGTMKAILDRRSIRAWTDEVVSEKDLEMILEAARQAPSGENAQPWRFIIVRDEIMRKKMGGIGGGGSSRRFTSEYVTKKMQQRFASMQDEQKKQRIFKKLTSGQVSDFMADAPINIVVCGKKGVWDMPYDTSAAIENMLIIIAALGLGACWVIAPCIDIRDEVQIKEMLGVPEEYKVVSIVSLGHPTRLPKPRPRLPMHELVFNEKWGEFYYEEPS